MNILSSFIIALTIFGCSACSKKTTLVTGSRQTDSVITHLPLKADSAVQVNYRFIVTFFSIGSGTERDQIAVFEKFVTDYNQKFKTNILYEKSHWGREGEVNYCLSLTEIPAADQQRFMDEAKAALKSAKQVHFSENEPCGGHKRR